MKHKVKIYVFFLSLTIGFFQLSAQQNTMPAGGETTGSTGSVSYSIGQIDYIRATGAGGSSQLGVQQTYEIIVLGDEDQPHIQLDLIAFPNPTTEYLNLRVDLNSHDHLFYRLSDLHGRILQEEIINTSEYQIEMSYLASATYLLEVYEGNRLLKSFKILKN